MAGAKTTPAFAPAKARTSAGASDARLCAASCGREGARAVPGVPDPGTLDPACASATLLTAAAPIQSATGNPPTRTPKPAEHPPRV